MGVFVVVVLAVLIFIGLRNKNKMKDNGTWTGSFSEKYAADRAARYEKERAAREEREAKTERCAACAHRRKCPALAKRNSLSCSAFRPE